MNTHIHGNGHKTISGRFGVPVAIVLSIVKKFKNFKVVTNFSEPWLEIIVVDWICNKTVKKYVQQSIFDYQINPE